MALSQNYHFSHFFLFKLTDSWSINTNSTTNIGRFKYLQVWIYQLFYMIDSPVQKVTSRHWYIVFEIVILRNFNSSGKGVWSWTLKKYHNNKISMENGNWRLSFLFGSNVERKLCVWDNSWLNNECRLFPLDTKIPTEFRKNNNGPELTYTKNFETEVLKLLKEKKNLRIVWNHEILNLKKLVRYKTLFQY